MKRSRIYLFLILVLLPGCDSEKTPACEEDQPRDQTATQPETPLNDESGVLSGKVIKIVDGDTLDILTDDKQTIRIRLEGIDTPERGQAFGTKAKEQLAELTFGKVVSVRSIGNHGSLSFDRCISLKQILPTIVIPNYRVSKLVQPIDMDFNPAAGFSANDVVLLPSERLIIEQVQFAGIPVVEFQK